MFDFDRDDPNRKREWITAYHDGVLLDRLTFGEALERADALRAALYERGLQAGDRVIVALDNSPQAVIAYLAISRADMVSVPVSPRESDRVLAFVRGHSAARAIISDVGITKLDRSLFDHPAIPSDALTIVYTSGTTGEPKGVVQGLFQWRANSEALIDHHHVDPDTVLASPLPLYHCNAHGLAMLTTWHARARYVLFNRATDDMLNRVNREDVHILSIVPAILFNLIKSRPDWRPHAGFRYVLTAAAALSPALLQSVLDTWHVRVIQGYGLSESVNFSCTLPIDLSDDLYHAVMFPYPSVGVALPGVAIRVGDNDEEGEIGELSIFSPANMIGYWRQPSHDKAWIESGDVGYYKIFDGVPFYYLTGRIKEQINRGGETISPIAVEDELRAAGVTAEIAVVGYPDDALGEEIGLISLEPIPDGILQSIRNSRRPKRVAIVQEIPRTSTGKVKRKQAAELLTW